MVFRKHWPVLGGYPRHCITLRVGAFARLGRPRVSTTDCDTRWPPPTAVWVLRYLSTVLPLGVLRLVFTCSLIGRYKTRQTDNLQPTSTTKLPHLDRACIGAALGCCLA